MHTLFRHPAQIAEAEDLKTAAVRENRAVPVHEAVQAPEPADDVLARTEMKVIGVGQDDPRPGFPHFLGRERLYRPAGPYRHENRSRDGAPCRVQLTGTGSMAPPRNELKGKIRRFVHPGPSEDEHGIPVTVEPVTPVNSLPVGIEDPLSPGESRHQQKEAGAGKGEIREEGIDGAELESGRYVEIHQLAPSPYPPVIPRKGLEGPGGCCPDGDDPSPFLLHPVYGFSRRSRKKGRFRAEAVKSYVAASQGSEGSRSDMEGNEDRLRTLPPDLFQEPLREMQPGRRGGHRSFLTGVDGLVSRPVEHFPPGEFLSGTPDIRRKWRNSHVLHEDLPSLGRIESDGHLSSAVDGDDPCPDGPDAEIKPAPDRCLPLHQSPPPPRAKVPEEKDLNLTACDLLATEEPCGTHEGIVQDQQVTLPQVLRKA